MEHNDYYYYNSPTPQQEFDRQASGVWNIASGLFAFIFVYLPLLTIGYFGATKILDHTDGGLTWIGVTLMMAGAAYFIIMLLKKLLLRHRAMGNPVWIILFIFCVSITCVMTPALALGPISDAFARWHWPHWLAIAIDALLATFIYVKYDFLDTF